MNLYQKIIYRLSCIFFLPIWKFFVKLEINNFSKNNLKKISGPMIITANHSSLLDGFIVCNSFPLFSGIHYVRYIIADNWMKKFTGFYLRSIGCFPTFYGQGLKVSLKIPREILENSNTVMIFPRGRRKIRLHSKKAKIGAAVLALESNVPILPVKIIDSAPGNTKKFFLRKRKIKVIIGHPYLLKDKIEERNNYNYDDFRKGTDIIIKEISHLNCNCNNKK